MRKIVRGAHNMYAKIQSSWVKHFDFIILDLICIQFSYVLSYSIYHGISSPYSVPIYLRIGLLLCFLHICIVFFTECYSGILRRGYLQELKAVVKYNFILVGFTIGYMFIIKQSAAYSRLIMIIFLGINMLIMYGTRIIGKFYIREKTEHTKNYEYLLLVTKRALVQTSTEKLLSHEYGSQKLKGIVIIDADITGTQVLGVPVVAGYDTMLEYARTNVVDQVLVNIYDSRTDEIANRFLEMGVTVHINIDRITSKFPNAQVEEVNGFTCITTSLSVIASRKLFIKRMISIAAGLVGLIATAICYVIFAPIIYIQSPGPIFFHQERIGMNGRRFRLYKFRSMYMDAEDRKKDLLAQNKMDGLMFKVDNDPRILPIGRFLRKTSIDELPQSINILRGDMTLVGTRPPTVDEYEKYDLHHKSRLATMPGLTGLWQVSGRSNITDFEEVVKLDTEYIKNWSLGLDLKIIILTFAAVLGRRGSV